MTAKGTIPANSQVNQVADGSPAQTGESRQNTAIERPATSDNASSPVHHGARASSRSASSNNAGGNRAAARTPSSVDTGPRAKLATRTATAAHRRTKRASEEAITR